MAIGRRFRALPCPFGRVSLRRVRRGTVQIHGDDVACRFFGLGYAHAHDRPLQLALMRIIARGRAAEQLTGSESLIAQDRYMRERGVLRGADRELQQLPEATIRLLDAYCGGINLHIDRPGQPLLLAVLGVPETTWAPLDVLLMLRLLAYVSLTQSQELTERFLIQSILGGTDADVAALKAVYAPHLDGLDAALLRGGDGVPPVTLQPTPLPFDPLCAAAVPHLAGSNAWAVAGHRSASGQALLANDPHLEVQNLPPVFYEVSMGGPDGWCVGVGAPGVPGLLAGRFTHLGVGVTYGFLDQVDFFVEEVRGGLLRRGDSWVEPDDREEHTIRVKGGEDVHTTLWRSDLGVIEGDLEVDGRYLCRAWSAEHAPLAPGLHVHEHLLKARDLDEAFDAVGAMPLSINYVLADQHGRIGIQQAGLAPRRAAGRSGLVPSPAWDDSTHWDGMLPASALARFEATERGVCATTNEAVNPQGGPVLVNAAIAGYRKDRLETLLGQQPTWSLDELRAMQHDVVSERAQRLMEAIRPRLPADDEALRGWQGSFDAESLGATAFARVRAEWLLAAFGGLFDRAHGSCEVTDPDLMLGLDPKVDGARLWLESNTHLVHGRGWDDALLDPEHVVWGGRDWGATLDGAIERGLKAPLKPWKRANRTLRTWLALEGQDIARFAASLRLQPLPGSPETLHQGRVLRLGGRVSTFAPVWRMAADLGQDELLCLLNGGPTDQPGRCHYRSGVRDFKRGVLDPLGPPSNDREA